MSVPHSSAQSIDVAEQYGAHNYSPLPIVIADGDGAWVTDVDGRRYLDFLAGYSALNFGHRHPDLVRAATAQLGRLTLTSRAFHNDRFGPFCQALAELAGMERVLLMNTGAEAVESGIKIARKWGYERKGVADGTAKIIVAGGNFHGRTISIVSFSDDQTARQGFGPFTPGFVRVDYGDLDQLEAAIDESTVAVLLEPVQGEAGVILPPDGYLAGVRRLCTTHRVLFIADEIQSGLGRTGTTFACDHGGVTPDLYLLGKALGGGIVPVSAVVGSDEVLGVLRPGQHGSTFGGNPFACAVGHAVVDLLSTGEYQARAQELGALLRAGLMEFTGHGVEGIRTLGLWAGVDITAASGKEVCRRWAERGVLAKDTHGSTIRLSPPLVVTQDEIGWALDQLAEVLKTLPGSEQGG